MSYTTDQQRQRDSILKQIEDCPPAMAVPEILRNALQAQGVTEVHVLRRLYPVEGTPENIAVAKQRGYEIVHGKDILSADTILVPKLAIRNNGKGIDPDKLKRITRMGHSEDDTNFGVVRFGVGGKVAGLARNPEGLLYISLCGEEGHNAALLRRHEDARGAFYGHVIVDGSEVWDAYDKVNELLAAECASQTHVDTRTDLLASGEDWTEVVFLGNDPLDDTTQTSGKRYWVGDVIYDRFYRMIAPHVNVYVDTSILPRNRTAMHGNRADFMLVKTLADASFYKENTPVTLPNGVVLRFLHDPSGKNSPKSHAIIGESNSLFAVVYNGEMHYVERYGNGQPGRKWGSFCTNFRISPRLSKDVSLIVELPADFPVHNDLYRIKLLWDKADDLDPRSKEFDPKEIGFQLTSDKLPTWLVELASTISDGDDQESMQEFMAKEMSELFSELSKSAAVVESKRGKMMGTPDESLGVVDLDDYRRDKAPPENEGGGGGGGAPDRGALLNPEDKTKIIAGKRKNVAPKVPDPYFLVDAEAIKAAGLEDYIASYNEMSLTINGLHPIFEEIGMDWLNGLKDQVSDVVAGYNVIKAPVQKTVVQQIIRWVFQMRNEKKKAYFSDQYDTAISPPMITNAIRAMKSALVNDAQRGAGSAINLELNALKERAA